ncbi:MAG: YihY/virulence factor BrkB family protein, partial [Micrococcaceae bacterium]|nr:YihY/virulence factor BrkB family protein [Micrococcaceae bacterium]
LVVGFSVLGILASGNQQLQEFVVDGVAKTTPGLIDTGDGGLATPQQLFRTRGFGWALVISTVVSLLTSLRWIAGLREGMRGVFGLLKSQSNIVLAKIKDLGVLLLLGISLILTTGLGVIASTALQTIIDFLELESTFSVMLTRVASLVVMLVLDSVVAVILFRLASGITMPRVALLQSAFIAGAGSTLLRYFSSLLLGSASSNPILAPFAVILGLFVWFYLLSQVYLLATAWGAVTTADIVATALRGNPKGLRSRSKQMLTPGPVAHLPAGWKQGRNQK